MSDHPRRRPVRWGRLFVVLFVIFLGLALLLHWSWSIGARKRLEALVATYKARGEPIEPRDFTVTGVADADNAALDLRAAAAAIDRKAKPWTAFEAIRADAELPLRPDELTLLRELIAGNPGVLPKVASATTKPAVDWQIVFTTPAIVTLLPDLTPQRELARFLRADALVARSGGSGRCCSSAAPSDDSRCSCRTSSRSASARWPATWPRTLRPTCASRRTSPAPRRRSRCAS